MLINEIYTVPDDKELFFVGDIHGNYDMFSAGVREFGIKDDDCLVSVGDLVDRGPNNLRCVLDFVTNPNWKVVRGNHEDMMIRGMTSREWYYNWLQNGGTETLEQLGHNGVELICEFLVDLPIVLKILHRGKTYGVVHAAIPHQPTVQTSFNDVMALSSNQQYSYNLIWDRNAIQYAMYEDQVLEHEKLLPITDIDFVVHGHTGVVEPLLYGNRLWLDTQFRSGGLTFAQYNDTGWNFNSTLTIGNL